MSKFSTEEKVRIVLDGMRYPEGIMHYRQSGATNFNYITKSFACFVDKFTSRILPMYPIVLPAPYADDRPLPHYPFIIPLAYFRSS